jgi:hypothetical protein
MQNNNDLFPDKNFFCKLKDLDGDFIWVNGKN